MELGKIGKHLHAQTPDQLNETSVHTHQSLQKSKPTKGHHEGVERSSKDALNNLAISKEHAEHPSKAQHNGPDGVKSTKQFTKVLEKGIYKLRKAVAKTIKATLAFIDKKSRIGMDKPMKDFLFDFRSIIDWETSQKKYKPAIKNMEYILEKNQRLIEKVMGDSTSKLFNQSCLESIQELAKTKGKLDYLKEVINNTNPNRLIRSDERIFYTRIKSSCDKIFNELEKKLIN